MMAINLFPLLSYVLISTFTPGPSNVSSASMGVLHGYKNTLNYQIGLAVGVFCAMLLSGWLSTTLLEFFPALEPALRYIGAGYILYLAFGLLKASYVFTETEVNPLGFGHGLLLQLVNPKLIVYAFTLFTAFLAPITHNVTLIGVAAILLAAISFSATSVWALFGTAIKRYLHHPRWQAAVNIILTLLLVYTAVALVGLI
ncbi:MAG: LysE family transporter [Anaerolineae bacterium]|nr:LysE family transporter [Anaerolineae bacterium]